VSEKVLGSRFQMLCVLEFGVFAREGLKQQRKVLGSTARWK